MFDMAIHYFEGGSDENPPSRRRTDIEMLVALYFPNLDEALGKLETECDEFLMWMFECDRPAVQREEKLDRGWKVRTAIRDFNDALREEARRQIGKTWWRREFGL